MSGVLVDERGRQWWTTAYACAQLRVTPQRLRDWVRRSARAGHAGDEASCVMCGRTDVFPHVDPPVRRGQLAGYLAQQLLDAEAKTAASTRGNSRAA